MKKYFIVLLVFVALSCVKESKKSKPNLKQVVKPSIQVVGNSVAIDSILLNTYSSTNLKDFYFATGFRSVWQSKKARKIILEQLTFSESEGLSTSDYNSALLKKYEEKYAGLTTDEKAKYDIIMTNSFQKYILHLTRGKLNHSYLNKNWDLKENTIDINQTITRLLKTDSLELKINQLKPNHVVYKSLKKALKIIHSYPIDDFTPIEFKDKIVLNDTNSLLIDIKKRLMYWRDMDSNDSLTFIYDNETNRAVKKFQMRHGLAADGVIGKGTVDALNFSKKHRKAQILANLERWKWFPKGMGKHYIIVNIADYKLTLVKKMDTVRTHKVIVGRDERPSPVLSSNLNKLVFNPTWTVPPTILKEDMIPAIKRNRNYLAQNKIKIYNKNGKEVAATSWKIAKANEYHYIQSPGSFNSLGLVKFLFSNRFSIYLHDTNHRDFFGKHKRSLSSGCVRVENPLKLAECLLDDEVNWNSDKITNMLQNKKTKSVRIPNEVKVHILYWTAWSENNTLIFRDDIYNLDDDLCQKLGK
jgi:murein L,D-transpeptidase YcbB/YkuD